MRIILILLLLAPAWAQQSQSQPQSEILKWQDGKAACVSLTYDDSSINQFRIDIPLLNERHMPGTFFVVTGEIQGSRNQPVFVGRPIAEISVKARRRPPPRKTRSSEFRC